MVNTCASANNLRMESREAEILGWSDYIRQLIACGASFGDLRKRDRSGNTLVGSQSPEPLAQALWLKPLSVQGSGSGIPRKVVSTRKTSGRKRVVGRPPRPSFSGTLILSSSPQFRLVLDWIQIFPF